MNDVEKRVKYKKKYVPKGRARNIILNVRLNEKESEKIRQDLIKTKKTKSEYIRDLIMNAQIKEKPDIEFYNSIKQLIRIGINLNQIAKKANSLNFINTSEYKKQTEDLNKFISDIRKEYL